MSEKLDTDQTFDDAIRKGIIDGVTNIFTRGYSTPLDSVLKTAVEARTAEFRGLLESAIDSCLTDDSFREEIAKATRVSLAKLLVQRFGGEIEKQVNALKSDPITRSRITLAVEEIAKSANA